MTQNEFDAIIKMKKDEIIDKTLLDLKVLINCHFTDIPAQQIEEMMEFRKKLKKLKLEERLK